MKKLSKKKKIIIGIIVVVLVIVLGNMVRNAISKEKQQAEIDNVEKARVEADVTKIVEEHNMEVEDIFPVASGHDSNDKPRYDLTVKVLNLEKYDSKDIYSLYNDLNEIEGTTFKNLLSGENSYEVKHEYGEVYALLVNGDEVWRSDDDLEVETKRCPNCGEEISWERRRAYTYCEDCYDELGFVEKTPEEQPSYVGKCTICNKDAYNEFQGSPYCDEHYEDAVLWAIDNVSGN